MPDEQDATGHGCEDGTSPAGVSDAPDELEDIARKAAAVLEHVPAECVAGWLRQFEADHPRLGIPGFRHGKEPPELLRRKLLGHLRTVRSGVVADFAEAVLEAAAEWSKDATDAVQPCLAGDTARVLEMLAWRFGEQRLRVALLLADGDGEHDGKLPSDAPREGYVDVVLRAEEAARETAAVSDELEHARQECRQLREEARVAKRDQRALKQEVRRLGQQLEAERKKIPDANHAKPPVPPPLRRPSRSGPSAGSPAGKALTQKVTQLQEELAVARADLSAERTARSLAESQLDAQRDEYEHQLGEAQAEAGVWKRKWEEESARADQVQRYYFEAVARVAGEAPTRDAAREALRRLAQEVRTYVKVDADRLRQDLSNRRSAEPGDQPSADGDVAELWGKWLQQEQRIVSAYLRPSFLEGRGAWGNLLHAVSELHRLNNTRRLLAEGIIDELTRDGYSPLRDR